MIETRVMVEPRTYHGPELRPHFILSTYRIEGNALIAFRGPCEVITDHLVDWEDRLQNDFIRAKEMIHFLGEFFGISLKEGIWIQRLIVSEIQTQLLKQGIKADREGDDLFISDRKLSVSIVTASPVSILLHLGLNVDAEGAPVKAVGLSEILEEKSISELVLRVLTRFKSEYESVNRAAVKVRPVI